jgi:hypothetical protein
MSTRPMPITMPGRAALGGTTGNELLTGATAAVLTVLLVAEGITILFLGGLLTAHMFIGLVLLGPVALKLGSTGYRFARYYAGTRAYREKGPPFLPLRLLAPALVAATIGVFATGVALLILGHGSAFLLTLHKATFIVWGACFAVHFLAHLPRMVRAVSRQATRTVAGSGLRLGLLGGSLAAGLALGVMALSSITGWDGGRG